MSANRKPVNKTKQLRKRLSRKGREAVLSESDVKCIATIVAAVEGESALTQAAYYQFVIRLSEYFRLEEIDLITTAARKSGLT